MFKRYEYHSKLSPAQVFARMEVHQRNVKRSGGRWDRWMEYRRKKGNTFSLYMSHSGKIFPGMPFLGTVEPEGEGSVIQGKFALWGNDRRSCLIFLGFPVCEWLLFSRSISAFDLVSLIVELMLFLGLFVLFRVGGEDGVGPILDFIHEDLCGILK